MIATKKLTTLAAMAGTAVLTTSASAFMVDDAKILVSGAANSPTLTVKFTGANTTMVELKLNGTSFGTRKVANVNKAGEASFTLDLALLADGENEVEVRLYDKDGKLVGSEKSTISAQSNEKSQVYLVNPKVGSTVLGNAEIKVGFGKDMKNSYVSFFVNNQFRSMTNNPPYNFIWDTTREANGWHEVEAWVVDGDGNTFKTRKVKVFVNNPGGRTNRPIDPAVKPDPSTTKPLGVKTPDPSVATTVTTPSTTVAPTVSAPVAVNNVSGATSSSAAFKPVTVGDTAIAMGQRNVAPGTTTTVVPAGGARTPRTVVSVKPNGPTNLVKAAGTGIISVTKGTRLPDMAPLNIMMNSKPINFDVAPRVQNGIPLTPFRHLFEANGGKVDWEQTTKEISASGDGRDIWLKIGNRVGRVNKIDVDLEIAPFIERGRTIVPLSFIQQGLNVNVEYDPATGHVFITSAKKQ
ncbi:MAG: stalk domain-containing protein [Fimbriimonadaceae bacterium]